MTTENDDTSQPDAPLPPDMPYRTLGRSGIQVSALGLGTMVLGPWGDDDADEAIRTIHAALDAGINLIDCADIYGGGVSEELVGQAIKGRRDDVVLATKFSNPMGPGPNDRGSSRRWIERALDASLRRLGTDHVDIYYAHRPDPHTDVDETLGALSDLVRRGKVRAIGTSTFPAEQLVDAAWVAERRGHVRASVEQPPYSLLARGIERSVLPTVEQLGMAAVTWAPLNGGWLTGKYAAGGPVPAGSRAATHADHFDYGSPAAAAKGTAVEALTKLAADAGIPLPQLALAFVLSHRSVASALLGPRRAEQLTSLLPAASVRLDDDLLDAVDAIVPPGVDLNPADAGWTAPALTDASLRRRAR
jgi:aryl-alcohol dehydrogenase-like predicted oxidoreductase